MKYRLLIKKTVVATAQVLFEAAHLIPAQERQGEIVAAARSGAFRPPFVAEEPVVEVSILDTCVHFAEGAANAVDYDAAPAGVAPRIPDMDAEDWDALIQYIGSNLREFRDYLRDEHGNEREPNARARHILNGLHEARKRDLDNSSAG